MKFARRRFRRCFIPSIIILFMATCLRHRPLSRRLDRCDRMIQNESRDPFGGNVYYVTMQITFLTRKFRNGERNLHCDVVNITTKWVSGLTLDCNGVFAIKAYSTKSTLFITLQAGSPRPERRRPEPPDPSACATDWRSTN